VQNYLDESNIGGLLAEALTADVEAILADQTSFVSADTAKKRALANVLGTTRPAFPQPPRSPFPIVIAFLTVLYYTRKIRSSDPRSERGAFSSSGRNIHHS
jgi:hypothetical protein